MDTLVNLDSEIALRIIRAQEMIIGPLAWDEAQKVSGFHLDQNKKEASFDGDAKEVLSRLVVQYEHLFGRVSDEVCKDAVRDILAEMPDSDVPDILK
jgi:hypothetical protein